MELAFATRALRSLCEDEATAREALGVKVAEKLKARLADLDSAHVLSEVRVGRLRPAASPRGRNLLLDLGDATHLFLRVNNNPVPRGQDGAVDWTRVNRVQVMGLETRDA